MTLPIQPHPNAPLGVVSSLPHYNATTFRPPCIILCRMNAPLVGFAYELIRRSIPCVVRGRDIGAQLIALVKKQKAMDLDDLCMKLGLHYQNESKRLIDSRRSLARLDDQVDCTRAIIARLSEVKTATVDTLLASLETLFSDDDSTSKVILSTIHKAKGLEYPTVFILDRAKTLPSKYARSLEQRTAERNLWYVAVTRSMDRLFYIQSDCWKNDNETL